MKSFSNGKIDLSFSCIISLVRWSWRRRGRSHVSRGGHQCQDDVDDDLGLFLNAPSSGEVKVVDFYSLPSRFLEEKQARCYCPVLLNGYCREFLPRRKCENWGWQTTLLAQKEMKLLCAENARFSYRPLCKFICGIISHQQYPISNSQQNV